MISFALFFLGEYANMILMSALTTILFLGGWLSPVPFLPERRLFLVHPEDLRLPVRLHLGAGDVPPLPLRPADAAGLEGVPAVLAGFWLVLTAGVLIATGWLPHA